MSARAWDAVAAVPVPGEVRALAQVQAERERAEVEAARRAARNARRRRRRAERPAGDTAPKAPSPEPDAPPAPCPHPSEDPDTPDGQGLVWCASCLRRVPPEVRRQHRGGGGWERLVELSAEEIDAHQRVDVHRLAERDAGWPW